MIPNVACEAFRYGRRQARVPRRRAELDALARDQDFLQDGCMAALVQQAEERLGLLQPRYAYCLKNPGALAQQIDGCPKVPR